MKKQPMASRCRVSDCHANVRASYVAEYQTANQTKCKRNDTEILQLLGQCLHLVFKEKAATGCLLSKILMTAHVGIRRCSIFFSQVYSHLFTEFLLSNDYYSKSFNLYKQILKRCDQCAFQCLRLFCLFFFRHSEDLIVVKVFPSVHLLDFVGLVSISAGVAEQYCSGV